MAKPKPTYEVNDEYKSIAQSLIDLYPEKFGDIPLSEICCVNVVKSGDNKEEPSGKRPFKFQKIGMPGALHNPYQLYIVIEESLWEELSNYHKAAVVCDSLHGIAYENGEIKVVSPDTNGYGDIFATLGANYLNRNDLPDLLSGKVSWKSIYYNYENESEDNHSEEIVDDVNESEEVPNFNG